MKTLILLGQLFFVICTYAAAPVNTNTSQFTNNKCEKVFTKEIVFSDELLIVIQELAKLYNKIMFSQLKYEELNQGKIIFIANMNELVQRLSPEEFKQAKRIIYNKDSDLISRYIQENDQIRSEQERKQIETEEAIKNVEAYAEAEKNTLRLKEILDKYSLFSDFDRQKAYFLSVRNEVEKILKKPILNINVENKNKESLLHLAAKCGDRKILVLVINLKAKVNAKDKNGNTALMLAIRIGGEEIVKMLIDAKAHVNAKSYQYEETALMWAAENGHTEIAQMLIDAKSKVDVKNYSDDTALMYAAYYGHKEIVQMLINAKANVNMKNIRGETALIMANRDGNAEIVKILKAAGAKK